MHSLAAWTHEQFDLSLNWDKIAWIKEQWGGPVILKGIMEVADAKQAASLGAEAIVVSNHGGRQLDGAPSTIAVLPEIVAALKESAPNTAIWIDGGIHSGQNLLKALALGAQGAMVGRPFLYGLGAMGKAGVSTLLSLMHSEFDRSMAFCGCRNPSEIGPHILRKAPQPIP